MAIRGFRLGIYVFKDVEIIDFAAPHGVFSVARRFDPELEAFLVADALRPNTGNLASTDDVDQVGWGLDQVTVDGLLGGEGGPVGAAHDAGVVPVAACVESLE